MTIASSQPPGDVLLEHVLEVDRAVPRVSALNATNKDRASHDHAPLRKVAELSVKNIRKHLKKSFRKHKEIMKAMRKFRCLLLELYRQLPYTIPMKEVMIKLSEAGLQRTSPLRSIGCFGRHQRAQ
jgi:hypothetical protein